MEKLIIFSVIVIVVILIVYLRSRGSNKIELSSIKNQKKKDEMDKKS